MYGNRHILKYADDTVIVSLLQKHESQHGPVVDEFVSWCDRSFLQLNISKTKDMVVDFRRKQPGSPPPTYIKGSSIEVVDHYKYLGTVIDNNLKFDINTDSICRKGQQRLYFLRKLNSFNVDKVILSLFYKSFIESVLTFAFIAWYGGISLRDKNNLGHIVKVAGKMIGCPQVTLNNMYEKQVVRKANSILDCVNHPLHCLFEVLPSGRRFRVPGFKLNRTRSSFIPSAIRLLNLHN